MYWDYEEKNIQRAKQLRKDMTPQERKLWYCFLRTYPMKFFRQRPIGNYIVDFYCSSIRLAVELDGGQHYEDGGRQYDLHRDTALEQLAIKVLRFSNTDVNGHFAEVVAEIDRVAKDRGRNPSVRCADSSPP